jgi:hypothetical protein
MSQFDSFHYPPAAQVYEHYPMSAKEYGRVEQKLFNASYNPAAVEDAMFLLPSCKQVQNMSPAQINRFSEQLKANHVPNGHCLVGTMVVPSSIAGAPEYHRAGVR